MGRYFRPMNLLDYTIQTGFLPHLKCADLADAVAQLVAPLAAVGDLTAPDDLVREVMRREAEGSTTVGGGLVIPHARFGQAGSVRIAVGTLASPLDLAAADEQPVDLVILLVGPHGDPRQMLRVLARLARLVRHDTFLDGLRKCSPPSDLRRAFSLTDPVDQ